MDFSIIWADHRQRGWHVYTTEDPRHIWHQTLRAAISYCRWRGRTKGGVIRVTGARYRRLQIDYLRKETRDL